MRSRKAALRAEIGLFTAALLLFCLCGAALLYRQVPEENKDPTIEIEFSDSGVAVTPYDPYAVHVEPETNRVTILQKGEYLLTGSAEEGQVVVALSKKKKVNLELAGLSLHCSTGPAIWVRSADKATITLAGKTVNFLSDGMDYAGEAIAENEECDACVFSQCDLDIRGSGALSVQGAYRDAIHSKGDLQIKKSSVIAEAPYAGLHAKTVQMNKATLELSCYTYGILAKSKKPEKGWVEADATSLVVEAGMAGIKTSGDLRLPQSDMVQIQSETPTDCAGTMQVEKLPAWMQNS